jgi:predicted Zn-dependent peptidase
MKIQKELICSFFEHLLFEGTENIKRGEWFKIVTGNGTNNANTSDDRTYYYEVFPSNNLELGLWMEAERMLHPVINQIGLTPKTKLLKKKKDCVLTTVLMDKSFLR